MLVKNSGIGCAKLFSDIDPIFLLIKNTINVKTHKFAHFDIQRNGQDMTVNNCNIEKHFNNCDLKLKL